jgi:acetyltransferase
MEQTKIFTALKGVRGRKAVDVEGLETLLVRFSELVADHPRLKEVDINPLLASSEKLIALDARILIFGRDIKDEDLPHIAIERA